MWETLRSVISTGISAMNFMAVIDILITATVIYLLLEWLKDSQAIQVLKGVLIIVALTQISGWIGLVTINYILRNLLTVGLIAIIIMFQPELRRTLEKIGSTRLRDFISSFSTKEESENITRTIEQVVSAASEMSRTKTGALIVFERDTNLKDIIDTGTLLDSVPTKQLLINIFTPNTPLHDGAVIIGKEDHRIKAAGCLLPLTQNRNLSQEIGTRHRSAIGMSEISDAIVVIVSEETGVISYALNGKLSRFLDAKALNRVLTDALVNTPGNSGEKEAE
ncbi:MAG: diadenylate cyclase CdaA [Eubacteriaceae bacterium]|nr:diadenylate cyclase CdaA [Eubacteriaceae bacterium]